MAVVAGAAALAFRAGWAVALPAAAPAASAAGRPHATRKAARATRTDKPAFA
ncbi:hypothetical protein ACIQVK_24930 [Streptomyces sp. NPDC090493]|uniref:hypothetical protein n=1 Tax=Streptomyces sp. NPDC090493 TaxID=3365964 RepID=UPI0038052FD9